MTDSQPSRRELPVLNEYRPLDNTAITCFAECNRRYYYSMVRHYRRGESAALHYGKVWHAMLEAHYKTGGSFQEVISAGLREWGNGHGVDNDHRTFERALNAYHRYVEVVVPNERPDDTVGWPDTPLVEMSVNTMWDEVPLPYAGKIDRVIKVGGSYYVEDHKTTSVLGATYFRGYDLSSQMLGYAWLVQQFIGKPIAGARINAYGILKSEDRFERQTVPFSQVRLKEWATKTVPRWMAAIIRVTDEWREHLLKTGEDDPSFWVMNHASCSGKYGMCEYASVCSLPEHVRERFLVQNFTYNPWNPLEATT